MLKIIGGLNKGAYGKVISLDEENSSAFVELVVLQPRDESPRIIRVSKFALKIVSSKEFKRATATDLNVVDKDKSAGKKMYRNRTYERN